MRDEQEQESQELIPSVQDTIIFNGKPLVVVRLPDGRPGVFEEAKEVDWTQIAGKLTQVQVALAEIQVTFPCFMSYSS